MPKTLTLKNIPDELHWRLKVSAEMHRRSLNSEVIICLETVLLPSKLPPGERLARGVNYVVACSREGSGRVILTR